MQPFDPQGVRLWNWRRAQKSGIDQTSAQQRAACSVLSSPWNRQQQDVSCVKEPIENRSCEKNAIEPIQYAAVARQNRRGIFDTGAALQYRFGEISDLSNDGSDSGNSCKIQPGVAKKINTPDDTNSDTGDEACDCSFNGFLRADSRCEQMPTKRTTSVIRRGVASP